MRTDLPEASGRQEHPKTGAEAGLASQSGRGDSVGTRVPFAEVRAAASRWGLGEQRV